MHELLRLAPNSAATWVTASLVAYPPRTGTAAISASRQALEIEPENYAALNNLGIALRASGKGREGTRVLAEAARANPDATPGTAEPVPGRAEDHAGRDPHPASAAPVITHVGLFGFMVLSVGSNIVISRNPALALRLETGRGSRRPSLRRQATGCGGTWTRRRAKAPQAGISQQDQPWSATAGHSMHTLGNPVLMFAAIAAWSVALVLLVGVVVPGSDKLGLAIGFVGFAALGALPAWVVRRRRQRDKAWANELASRQ